MTLNDLITSSQPRRLMAIATLSSPNMTFYLRTDVSQWSRWPNYFFRNSLPCLADCYAVWSPIVMIMSSASDCLSFCLTVLSVRPTATRWIIVPKRYMLQQKCLNKWIGIVLFIGTRYTIFYNFQPRTPIWSLQIKIPPQQFWNYSYLIYLAFSITWPFCLCCYEHGRILLSRWSLINVSYAVRSAVLATAAHVVVVVQ